MREKNGVPGWAFFALALAIIGVVIYAAGTVKTPVSSSRPMLNTLNNPTATPTPSATLSPNYPPLPPESGEGTKTQGEFVFPNSPEPAEPPAFEPPAEPPALP